MTTRLPQLGRHPMAVVGVVIGVLVMHGLGDPAMSHSGMAMGETSMAASAMAAGMQPSPVGASPRHSTPAAPAGEMAMAAICAFAVLLRRDRVTRMGSGSRRSWVPIAVLRSIIAGGPEPPVPRVA